jgi:methylthioribose-1-phosphate isomerase
MSERDDNPTDQPRDPSRRQFFRAFGRQTATSAGQALRAVDELRRGSAGAATELLGLGARDPQASAARIERRLAATASPNEADELAEQGIAPAAEPQPPGFRSPYLLTDDALVLLDQREPFGRGATLACTSVSMLSAAMRRGVAGGGPVLGQVAAYGLVLAVKRGQDRPRRAREPSIRAAANMLRMARPQARAVGWAVERMLQRWEMVDDDADRIACVGAMREEADQIASQATLDHARLGRLGAESLAQPEGRPLALLMHGDMGPLAGGMVGTGFAVVQSVVSAGRNVHVWLSEAAPGLEGRRIAAPQLAQADIGHTVIPDTAVGWLLAEQPVDACLLRADWVCANGDSAALLGSLNIARLAGVAGVPVYACAPGPVIDRATPNGSAIPRAYRLPELDVLPPGAITAFITEDGVRGGVPAEWPD